MLLLLTEKYEHVCLTTYFTKFSLANYNEKGVSSYLVQVVTLILVLILILNTHYFKYQDRLYYRNYDQRHYTVDDYTMVLRNIKKKDGNDHENDLRKFIENKLI